MERKRYYVSVQSGTIMPNQGDAGYELEIEATAEEVALIFRLFDKIAELDLAAIVRTPLPGIPYHHDWVNDDYDVCLQEIYQMLYHVGTEQTKEHIQSMNML